MEQQQRQQIEKRLEATMLLRKQIETLPSNTSQDIERKTKMLENVEDQTKRLRYAADMLLAATWEAKNTGELESALNGMLAEVEYKFKDLPADQLEEEAGKRLRESDVTGRFHWSLEFPEVFMDKRGFDGVVGNPPFLGGSRISGILGDSYLRFLLGTYEGTSGNGDLVAFFLRRGAHITNSDGLIGLITTNSISQGTTREGSLDRLVRDNCRIIRAQKSYRWPGSANVFVSLLHLTKRTWSGNSILDSVQVESITPYLDAGDEAFEPFRLTKNLHLVFRGSTISGEGFILTPEEAEILIRQDPNCKGSRSHPESKRSVYNLRRETP